MVLFGKEFDADERAEVGGGLRGVKGDGDAERVTGNILAVYLRENSLRKFKPVADASADYCNSI
jgi:hypothetical protein